MLSNHSKILSLEKQIADIKKEKEEIIQKMKAAMPHLALEPRNPIHTIQDEWPFGRTLTP